MQMNSAKKIMFSKIVLGLLCFSLSAAAKEQDKENCVYWFVSPVRALSLGDSIMLSDELVAYNPRPDAGNKVDLGDKGIKCLRGWHCLEFYGLQLAMPDSIPSEDKHWHALGKFFVMQDFVEFSRNGLESARLRPVVVYESKNAYKKNVINFEGVFYLSEDSDVVGFSILEGVIVRDANLEPKFSTYWAHGKAIPLRCY